MPRRKGTRQATKRSKPALKNIDLDTSMTEEERKQKLEVFSEDFKVEATARKTEVRRAAKILADKTVNQYNVELLKIPLRIREMPLKQFFENGGYPSTVVAHQVPSIVTSMSQSHLVMSTIPEERNPLSAVDNNIEAQTPAHSTKADSNMEPPTTGRTLRTRKGQKQTNPTPASVKRSQKKKQPVNSYVTPASHLNPHVFATPAVTPKFDPRLPFTPHLLREPKEGERIMSMSGSPLANTRLGPTNSVQIIIPSGSGQSLHINSEHTMSPNSISAGLDDVAKQNLLLFQQKLAAILKTFDKNS